MNISGHWLHTCNFVEIHKSHHTSCVCVCVCIIVDAFTNVTTYFQICKLLCDKNPLFFLNIDQSKLRPHNHTTVFFCTAKHGGKNCLLTCFCSSCLSLSSSWRFSCSLSSCILFLSSLSSISICAQRGFKLSTVLYTSEMFRQRTIPVQGFSSLSRRA